MSSGSESGGAAEAGAPEPWSDWEEDEEVGAVQSLFTAATFPSVDAALAHDAAEHGFDLRAFRLQASAARPGAGARSRGSTEGGVNACGRSHARN
jgi:hypothetical protein